MFSSVTRSACLATLSTSVPTGSARPLLLNAALRSECDAVPSPSNIRLVSVLRACLMSDMYCRLQAAAAPAVNLTISLA
jgi:hypothetical protein